MNIMTILDTPTKILDELRRPSCDRVLAIDRDALEQLLFEARNDGDGLLSDALDSAVGELAWP